MTSATLSPSGLPDVDRQWGGLATGCAYLLVGRAGAGRSALALQTARASTESGERCLLISPRPPQALVEVGRDIGLDLAAAHGAGQLRLLRIPSAADLAARGSEGLAAAYRDLAGLVTSDRPGRVIIEDLTPLVQFDTFERFHDAFASLVQTLRDQRVTLVVGLGDPANEASQRLLDVVGSLVDGTIRLGADGDLALSAPDALDYPSSDGASLEVEAPPAPAQADPFQADPFQADSFQDAADTSASRTVAEPAFAPPSDEFETTFAVSAEPASTAETTPDEPVRVESVARAPMPAEPTSAPGARSPAGGAVATEIVPPSAPDPSLLAPSGDPFGHDPADALVDQGFLADSGRQPGSSAPDPAPVAASAALAAPPASRPSFSSLGAPSPENDASPSRRLADGFHPALDAAFASRESGMPFVVVALRMDPSSPSAEHFDSLEDTLRSALRSGDEMWVDKVRGRMAAVLPGVGSEVGSDAGQALFARLQSRLREELGAAAEPVLESIAAVTIVDGQPFDTPADLLAYAVEN